MSGNWDRFHINKNQSKGRNQDFCGLGVWALWNCVPHTEIQLTNIFKVYEEPEEIAAEEEEPVPVVEEEEYEAPPPPAAGISQGLLHRQKVWSRDPYMSYIP